MLSFASKSHLFWFELQIRHIPFRHVYRNPDVQQSATYVTVFGRKSRGKTATFPPLQSFRNTHGGSPRKMWYRHLKSLATWLPRPMTGRWPRAALTVKALVTETKHLFRGLRNTSCNKAAPSRPRCIAIEAWPASFMDVGGTHQNTL